MASRPLWIQNVGRWATDVVIDWAVDDPQGYVGDRDDPILDDIERAVLDVLCQHYGHEIIDDHCNLPEHRFCVYCHRLESALVAEHQPSKFCPPGECNCGFGHS